MINATFPHTKHKISICIDMKMDEEEINALVQPLIEQFRKLKIPGTIVVEYFEKIVQCDFESKSIKEIEKDKSEKSREIRVVDKVDKEEKRKKRPRGKRKQMVKVMEFDDILWNEVLEKELNEMYYEGWDLFKSKIIQVESDKTVHQLIYKRRLDE